MCCLKRWRLKYKQIKDLKKVWWSSVAEVVVQLVDSDTRDTQFESQHRYKFFHQLCIWFEKIKPRMAHWKNSATFVFYKVSLLWVWLEGVEEMWLWLHLFFANSLQAKAFFLYQFGKLIMLINNWKAKLDSWRRKCTVLSILINFLIKRLWKAILNISRRFFDILLDCARQVLAS